MGFVSPRSDVGLSCLDQSACGAAAKGFTKLLVYPLDTWKSRQQARRFGSLDEFRGLWTLRGMYRGVLPKLLFYTPYQAVYIAVYVRARDALVMHSPWPFGGGALSFALAGVIAEVSASAFRLPMEVAKLRMQLGIYDNCRHALQDFLLRPSGMYGQFVPQTLLHDSVYSAVAWLVFESSRQIVFAQRGENALEGHESLALGTMTGAFTALVTTPFDVVKTRIVGRSSLETRPGIISMARDILREEGILAFGRGVHLRVLHLAPSHGLYMLFYEMMKTQLAAWRVGTSRSSATCQQGSTIRVCGP